MSRKCHRWTDEEKKQAIDLYHQGKMQSEIAEIMGTTETAVGAIIYRSGATKKPNFWNEEDDKKLADLRKQGKSLDEIAKILGRSKSSVYSRSSKIGLNDRKKNEWTQGDIDKVKDMYMAGERRENIANAVGRSVFAINKVIDASRLKRKGPNVKKTPPPRIWTPEMDEKLRILKKQDLSRKEIAKQMNMTESQVHYRIDHLKLGKPVPPTIPWKEEDIGLLVEMYRNGLPEKEIAEKLNRTKASIASKVYDLDLYDGVPRLKYPDDLTDMKFGWLTAIRRVDDEITKDGKHYPRWECKCQCGNIIIARRSNLCSGNTNSCGCYKYKRECDVKKPNTYNLTDYEYAVAMDSDGAFFFFDKQDFPLVSKRSWKVADEKHAFRVYSRMLINGESKIVLLHRYLCGLKHGDPELVDHKHGNPNDNRRENIRLSTQMKNAWNLTKLNCRNTSGYTGVNWSKVMNAWCAEITTNGEDTKIGYYSTPEEAFEARKKYELKQRGELSYVNSDKDDGYFNPNTIDYDPTTFKTVEEAEKDYAKLVSEGEVAV